MYRTITPFARPFDVFVAFLVGAIGLYSLIDPWWPPRYIFPEDGWKIIVINIEMVYLTIAGLGAGLAIVVRPWLSKHSRKRLLVASINVEMFGWLFIAFAALVMVLTAGVIPLTVLSHYDYYGYTGVWVMRFLFWCGIAVSSFIRYYDMRKWFVGKIFW